MTLINTSSSSLAATIDDTPTSFDDFLKVLSGLSLTSNVIEIDVDRQRVTIDGKSAGLCAKEIELLTYLAARADHAVSRAELFATVWSGSELGDDSRTVDAHIRRLRKKLSIAPDLISTVRGQGYRLNSAPSIHVLATPVHALAA
ncbi:winged helix-turn-helix transcriptional regulator [Schaalia sp. ZJ405]|uniref:winged helix-turn-helix domain-containing protein n=1 Tax=unclassified Schaalia TaxID=2691889 RepID=UPI0013ECF390|nr:MULTISPECIES: winged helix-turn-helix domain-containing protein [unclassified Schaalia]QPK82259.1 winged helix-turn-helix transcriptional regulator [Schaalia sp. ZJ405]